MREIPTLTSAVVAALLGLSAATLAEAPAAAPPSVAGLRCEYEVDPLGIDVPQPRLSWQLRSPERGALQSAYQVQVTRDGKTVWDTERVATSASVHVPYGGPALESSRRYTWRVRVWDAAGKASAWSAPASWEMGLLKPGDWTARWIQAQGDEPAKASQPAPMLRGTFAVKGAVKSARAYVTSLGLYELEINGKRVGDRLFTPGWTSYHHRLQYQTYDVTSHLRAGENAIGATLGDGWYRGFLAWADRRAVYGDRLALLCQVRIEYEDGRVVTVGTDDKWKSTTGPIRSSDIYNGETYDARLERPGWSAPGYADADWAPVVERKPVEAALIAPAGPPVRRIEEIRPVKLLKTPAGETVFDMGQNMVGHVRLKVRGPAGTTVTLRHAEVLDKAGNFYTANLRAAKQLVTYVLKGGTEEVYEPHFTFQGFRYVAVEGWPAEPTLDALTGVVVHSDMPVTGQFTASNPLLNQLQHNILWGQKGNFLDVPDRLPAARRAAGLDRGRPGLLAHRELQHGRGRLLHQVAGRRGRGPEREGQRAVRGARRAEPARQVRRGLRRLGRRRDDHPVEHVPRLRRRAPPRAAVPEHEGVGRVHAARGRRRRTSGRRASTSATGSPSPRPRPTTRAPRPART